MDDGAGHPGGERDDASQCQQHGPHRIERHRADRLAEEGQADGDESRDRRRAGERDHAEVRDDPDRRELVEVSQRDWQHGQLGGRAHAERAKDCAPRQGGHDDAQGGGERELEARVEEIARSNGEDRQRRQGEAVRHRGVSLQKERGQDEHRHDDGAQHRGRRADDEREPDHDDDRGGGRGATREAREATERPHRGGQERHVEAGNRQDVIDPGAPEGIVDVARQLGTLAEQEAGQQRRRRRRQRAPHGGDRRALHAHRPRR